MNETGIIMSGDHPQKIINLLKTQTRRTYGLEKVNENPDHWIKVTPVSHTNLWRFESKDGELLIVKCPYGQVGDRLWVRETWMPFGHVLNNRIFIHYRASESENGGERLLGIPEGQHIEASLKWKPSIHMFKWMARIWLEITEVRVERVQEISAPDIYCEGITGDSVSKECLEHGVYHDHISKLHKDSPVTRVFIKLWDSLNAKSGYSFDFNPWVWPINFKVIN